MKRVLKLLLSLPFLLALGAVGVYALGGFVVGPWWIKRELPQLLKTHLDATGSVGEIAINPFKLTVDVRDFALTESGGTQPAIAFDRLFVDFEATSLFKRAWTFAEITLERPRTHLEVDAKGALNLARLAPKTKDNEPKKETASELPRLLLQKFALKQGLVTFTDKGVSQPATAKLAPVEFELRDLSTLPDQRGDYTLSARLPAGGTLGWRGTISLAPIASAGLLELKAVKLATVWQFMQDKLRIDEPGGSAALTLKYDSRYAENKLIATASDMALRINDISVRQKGASEAALTAGELALTGGNFNLAERKIQFAALALNKIAAHTLLDADGNANWAQLSAPASLSSPAKSVPAPAAEAKAASGAPWQVGITAVDISDVHLTVLDEGFVKPLAIDIGRTAVRAGVQAAVGAETAATIDNIAVDIENIRVAEVGSKDTLVSLATATLTGGAFNLAEKKFSAESIKLSKAVTAITRDAKGEINLAAAFARKKVKPPEPSTMTAEIGAIELTDGNVAFKDLGAASALALDIQSIRLLAKNIRSTPKGLTGTTGGTIPFEAGLQIKQGGTLRAQGTATPEAQRATVKLDVRSVALMPLAAWFEKATALKLASGAFSAAGQLDWSGQGKDAGVRYNGNAGIDAFRLASASDAGANVEASAQAKQAGSLRVQGTVSTNPQRAALDVDLRNFALAPLNPFVAKQTTLTLASGAAHAAGKLDWTGQATGKRAPGVRFTGKASVDDLRLNHESGGERLFAWKELLTEGVTFDSAGKQVRIDDMRLSGPAGKIAIAKDHSTNFADIVRKPAAGAAGADAQPAREPSAKTPTAAAPPAPTDDAPFVVSVERVHVRDGELDFSDLSLVLPFATVIREFGGTITGLSTQPGTRAALKLDGRVDEFGEAQVSGTVSPLEPKVFTDITMIFRNVALSPLSPYSATFAGRRIASGKLSLDLQYKINNSEMLGENKVLLEQFTLGERVASPTAISLPLDLAIALLTDADGKIDLSVPVRGNVDKPDFAYGALVWQAIRIVLTNIVTAPFRALGSLFGGSSEKVDAIGFAAGRAQLAPPEREKLTRAVGVLNKRPQLRLGIEGRYDPRHDGAALRESAARRALAERAGIKLTDTQDAALVNFDNAKTQRTIEALLEERAGKDSIDKFKTSHEKSTGKAVSRVNPALALVGRGSADRQFYEAMFNQVVTLQPLDKDALTALAAQRSAAVAEFLKTGASLDATRINTKAVAQTNADKPSEVATALSLDVGK